MSARLILNNKNETKSVIARTRGVSFFINCINVEKISTDVLTTFGYLLLSTSGNLFVLNDNIAVVRPLIGHK